MKAIIAAMAATALLAGAVGSASAEPHPYGYDNNNNSHQDNGQHRGWGRDYGNDNNGGNHHWQRGQRMGYNDWNSSSQVDWRQHHLRQPPRGYEWRERNGQYVMAAITTGLIFSIIANSGH